MTLKMMIAMMIQVRAEVSEKLDGLVESVADLRAQFEGTLARVCPRSTMLTFDFLHTLILVLKGIIHQICFYTHYYPKYEI